MLSDHERLLRNTWIAAEVAFDQVQEKKEKWKNDENIDLISYWYERMTIKKFMSIASSAEEKQEPQKEDTHIAKRIAQLQTQKKKLEAKIKEKRNEFATAQKNDVIKKKCG